jgi:hypothetical protein
MAEVNVSSAWEDGDLVFRDKNNAEIATFDGVNRKLRISSGASLATTQTAATAKTDAAAVMTAAEMINGIVVHTVTTGRTLTTPTGAEILAGLPSGFAVGDTFLLHVITVGTGADDISTLTAGDGDVTFVGKVTVGPDTASIAGYGTWKFRYTGSNAFVGYRIG